jgi:HAE1 family hydrophobic/amphiphilic exporter-1
MLAATILTLIFVPVFYVVIERWREGPRAAATDHGHLSPSHGQPVPGPAE